MKITTCLLLLIFIFTGCSSSKIVPSQWQSEDFNTQKIDRILVYVSTEDNELQTRFENKMAQLFTDKSITPLKMHEQFPDITYKENHTREEINQFVSRCKAKNIDKILLASKKSKEIDTVHTKSLHNYMNSLEPLNLTSERMDEEDLTYDTKELITYTLEAAVYDIEIASEHKPIASTTLKATNPKSLDKLESLFLNAIEKLFKKK